MKIKKIIISLGILVLLSSPVSASEGELTMYLEVLYFNTSMTTVVCDRLLYIQAGSDLSSFSDKSLPEPNRLRCSNSAPNRIPSSSE